MIEVGNKIVEGRWWDSTNCPTINGSKYGFKLGSGLLKFVAYKNLGGRSFLKNHSEKTSCNRRGLTSLGRRLIKTLMSKGMLIDVDHMSNKSFYDTLSITNKKQYPLVASHVQFFDLNKRKIRHERMRTKFQLMAIANSGGMIGAMLKDDFQDTDNIGKKLTIQYKNGSRILV